MRIQKEYSLLLLPAFWITNKCIRFSARITFWHIIIFVLVVLLIISYLFINRKRYKVTSMTVNIPFSLGNITYALTEEDRIVAWKMYVQLKTRKAALVFDEEYDVIVDVYDSLYEIFKISRELLSNLPLHEIESEPCIADLILRVQNDGLRPHLTKWQSDFRKWWKNATTNPEDKNVRPQDTQMKYPKYKELIVELKEMNIELSKYAEQLLTIAKTHSRRNRRARIKRPTPLEPSTFSSST